MDEDVSLALTLPAAVMTLTVKAEPIKRNVYLLSAAVVYLMVLLLNQGSTKLDAVS